MSPYSPLDKKKPQTPPENTWPDDTLQAAHEKALKEKPMPKEGFSPLPIILIFLTAGLLFWAGVYIAHNSGHFDPLVYDPNPPERVERELTPEELLNATLAKGARVYRNNCQQCHQAEGQGVPGVYPPLAESSWVRGDPNRGAAIVIGGLSGPIEVLGKKYNNAMASLAQLSDKDIAAVLTYIRMKESWGHQEAAITPEEVAEVRRQWGSRTGPWSVEELLSKYPLEQ